MELSKRAISAKEKGRKGGLATARNSTPEFLEARAAKAGCTTRDKYGLAFYRYLQTRKSKSKTPTEKIIRTIIPDSIPLPNDSLQLMQAATKTLA